MLQALIFYLYFYILKSHSEERGVTELQKSFDLATKSAFLQRGTHSHTPSLDITLKYCREVQKIQEHWSESSLGSLCAERRHFRESSPNCLVLESHCWQEVPSEFLFLQCIAHRFTDLQAEFLDITTIPRSKDTI